MCGRGGIGRRAALRSLFFNRSGSSSLLGRTNFINKTLIINILPDYMEFNPPFNPPFCCCSLLMLSIPRAPATVIITVIRLARPRATLSLNVIPMFPRARALPAFLFSFIRRRGEVAHDGMRLCVWFSYTFYTT